MAYGTGVYGYGVGFTPTSATASPTVTLVSSRRIDLVSGLVVYDDDGNPDGMDDTAQRVVLLARRAALPDIIGPDFEAATEDEIRKALVPVTGGQSPAATINSVSVTSAQNGSRILITYTNNLTGTQTSVTL
jgi:hypothetical protein